MEQFVKDMIRLEEGALNPTLFIQSTYNSPNGWIAMQSNCTGYNQTYVHRGCSFELAVQDARMMAAEAGTPLRILTGCYDEMTEEYYLIRGKRDYWKKVPVPSEKLLDHADTPGTIGGEGSAFFVLSSEPGAAKAAILDMRIVYTASAEALQACVSAVIADAGLHAGDISLVLSGLNGDARQTGLYEGALALFPDEITVAGFKHLCGEYDTASGFGLWLANDILLRKEVPPDIILKKGVDDQLEYIVIINHYILGTASVWLIGAPIL
jgi:hypothetical protein